MNPLLIQLKHIHENYANIYATYEVTANNNHHMLTLQTAYVPK